MCLIDTVTCHPPFTQVQEEPKDHAHQFASQCVIALHARTHAINMNDLILADFNLAVDWSNCQIFLP